MATKVGNLPLCKYRYALFVSYLGTKYYGSQRLIARGASGQQDTIQEALETGLEGFLPVNRCRLTTASRTDKGVHAFMNVWTLPLMDYGLPTETLKSRLNRFLALKKHDILVNEVVLVPASFHPRTNVVSREYIYRFAVPSKHKEKSFYLSANYHDYMGLLPVTELYKVLPVPTIDFDKAQEAMQIIDGEHDFASFAASLDSERAKTRRRVEINLIPEKLNHVDDSRENLVKFYRFHIKSKAFLHNQVRRMVGAILSYATFDKIKLKEIKDLIENPSQENWNSKIDVAEPFGLYLYRISFSKEAFDGSIKTHADNTEEPVGDIYCEKEVVESDDGEGEYNESNEQPATKS